MDPTEAMNKCYKLRIKITEVISITLLVYGLQSLLEEAEGEREWHISVS